MRTRLALVLTLLSSAAFAQTSVRQSGTVTPNQVPWWITSGVIGGGVTSADSPVTSFGVTNNGGQGFCVNSDSITAAGRNTLCFGVATAGSPAQLIVSSSGTAAPLGFQFVINGSVITPAGGISAITVGSTTIGSGTSNGLLYDAAGVIGNTAAGTNGQLFLGVTSGAPNWSTMSGDATISNAGALTLATVNGNTGSFGSATNCTAFTTNGKGLITAASAVTCTPAVGSITGLGTGVGAALAINVGSAGSPVVNGGALGTPSSGVGTNLTALNGSNISTGTVGAAVGGAGTITGALKGSGAGVVTQAACADLSNGATGCSTATGTSGATIPLNNGNNTFSGTTTHSGQLISTFGTPTIASGACGATTNGTISGTNQSGIVTIGAATTTTCTISFSTTITAPGACVIFPASAGAAAQGTTVARVGTPGTTNWVITGTALASTVYAYICL